MKTFIVAALLGLAVAAPSENSASDVGGAADANVAAPVVIRRQEEEGEETFQAIVVECQIKLATGQITGTLDDCVLDALGIQRRQIGGTNISVSPEELEHLTEVCAAKTPGDQAKIYECVVKLIGLSRKASIARRREAAEAIQRRQLPPPSLAEIQHIREICLSRTPNDQEAIEECIGKLISGSGV